MDAMPEGWVTPAQFQALIDARCAKSPSFARNAAMLFKHQGEWRKWPLHLQKDLFEKLGVLAVLTPLGPGSVIVEPASISLLAEKGNE